MKYSILGFQQQKLIDSKLTLEDALLLRTIKDMYSSDRMESIIQNELRYIWINQPYLLEQIPIIGSMSKLKRMLAKLSDDGLLDTILITNKKGVAGRFFYVKYTKKLDDIEDYDTKVQNDTRLGKKGVTKVQNDTRPKFKMTLNQSSKWPNKDSSIKDSSIKDIYSENSKLNEAIIDFIDMRKQTKSKMTDKAIILMLNKLKKLSSDENAQIEILNQSIMNNWKGIFPLKTNHDENPKGNNNDFDMTGL